MKVSRLLGLALVAMLVFGSIVAVTSRALAKSGPTPQPQPQAQGCDVEDNDAAEAPESNAPDTDDVQCGEQGGVEDGSPEADSAQDQMPSYTGSLTADEAKYEGMSEADESATLAGQTSISEAEARSAALAANPGATVAKVELDNENGVIVYSVELSDGSDVKVDAGNAAVLFTDSGGDLEN